MIIIFFSKASFSSIFLSIIDVFKVFSYNRVIPFIQSGVLLYRIFNFEMYSLVIRISIDVNRAVQEVNTIPKLGLKSDIVEVAIVDPDLIKLQ